MATSASSGEKGMLCLSVMRRFAGFAILASALCLLACADGLADTTGQASGQGLPNVLTIMVDDLGYGDLSCYGAEDARTPNIDRLAASGIRFTDFYANCCVCSPTRASLVSGRYPDRVGVPGVIRTHAENSWGYLAEFPTIADMMHERGYQTVLIGKWHLGLDSPNLPSERGFDLFRGFLCDMIDDYWKKTRHGINYMRDNDQPVDVPGHATDVFTQWAVDYIASQAQNAKPWFLFLAYNAPHSPIQPPQEWLDRVQQREPGISLKRAKLVALVEHLDHGIGQVLEALAKSPDAANTMILFTSDNGGSIPHGSLNGPLRGGKQDMYEGGVKVPTCIAWPGKIEPGQTTGFRAMTMDIYPTLCEAAGIPIDHEIDGLSFLPLLEGKPIEPFERPMFYVRREGGLRYQGQDYYGMRRGDWKLLHNGPFEPLELFNMADDPAEQNDLAQKRRDVFGPMSAALRRHIQQGGAVPWQKPAED